MNGASTCCEGGAGGTDNACAEPEPELPAADDLEDSEDLNSQDGSSPRPLAWTAARGLGGWELRQLSDETSDTQLSQLSQRSATSTSSTGALDVTSVQAWSPDDVAQWMRSMGLGHCAESLRQHHVGGGTLLGLAGGASPSASLAALGVSALGDRKRILKAIRQLEIDTVHVTKGTGGPWALHFMFVSASPLVRMTAGGTALSLKALDVEAEQHAVCQAMADAGYACRFQHVYATVRTLGWAILHQSCCVLIFSGHTLPNGQWLLETETGEALPFEPLEIFQQEGAVSATSHAPHASHAQASQTSGHAGFCLATDGPTPEAVPMSEDGPGAEPESPPLAPSPRLGGAARFRLVVLHVPHPDAAAAHFLDAGVPHVITIERSTSNTEADNGASVFLQNLCQSLVQGRSVQQAFKHAERLTRHRESCLASSLASSCSVSDRCAEAKRLALLPQSTRHCEVLMPSLSRGPPMRCSPARTVGQFPRTGLDLSSCRRLEMWRVLRALRFRRLVQVLGPAGVGKRTLVCLVANYTWQRHLFPDGVHYVHIKDLFQVTTGVAASGTAASAHTAIVEEVVGSAFFKHTPVLPGHKLLVLDGCEELYQHDCHDAFIDWLSRLLTENPELQLLITARTHLQVSTDHSRDPLLGNLEDHTVEVRELSEADAVQMLRWICRAQPQLRALTEAHGELLASFCGQLPFAIDLFAQWAASQPSLLGDADLATALLAKAEAAAGAPAPAAVLGLAVSALPGELLGALRRLLEVPGPFSAALAAELWGTGLAEAEARLASLRARRLLEPADSGPMAARLALPPGAEAPPPGPPCYRLHPLLREHLRRGAGLEGAGAAAHP